MILSFADSDTKQLFLEAKSKRFQRIIPIALRKLIQLHHAETLNDLSVSPNHQLEALRKDLKGHHSIQINKTWRIIFRWTDLGPTEVQIVESKSK